MQPKSQQSYRYRPIIVINKLLPSSSRQIEEDYYNNLLNQEEEENSDEFPLMDKGFTGVFWKNWKIMGICSITGFLVIAIIWLSQHTTECCNSNKPQNHLWPFSPTGDQLQNSPPQSHQAINNPAPPDVFDPKNVKALEKIRHKMMSVTLKYIIDFMLKSPNFQFSCPPENHSRVQVHSSRRDHFKYAKINATKLTYYPDQLNCQKYYACDEDGRFTPGFCEDGQGFDKVSSSCLNGTKVQLCNDVGIFRGYNCTTMGLHPYIGDCNRFVLCTQERVAFVANCLPGYFFDPELLICLSSTESEC